MCCIRLCSTLQYAMSIEVGTGVLLYCVYDICCVATFQRSSCLELLCSCICHGCINGGRAWGCDVMCIQRPRSLPGFGWVWGAVGFSFVNSHTGRLFVSCGFSFKRCSFWSWSTTAPWTGCKKVFRLGRVGGCFFDFRVAFFVLSYWFALQAPMAKLVRGRAKKEARSWGWCWAAPFEVVNYLLIIRKLVQWENRRPVGPIAGKPLGVNSSFVCILTTVEAVFCVWVSCCLAGQRRRSVQGVAQPPDEGTEEGGLRNCDAQGVGRSLYV